MEILKKTLFENSIFKKWDLQIFPEAKNLGIDAEFDALSRKNTRNTCIIHAQGFFQKKNAKKKKENARKKATPVRT